MTSTTTTTDNELVDLELFPFQKQVSGSHMVLQINKALVCKPHFDKEEAFYRDVPEELRDFIPAYYGTVNVTFTETDDNISFHAKVPKSLLKKPDEENLPSNGEIVDIAYCHSNKINISDCKTNQDGNGELCFDEDRLLYRSDNSIDMFCNVDLKQEGFCKTDQQGTKTIHGAKLNAGFCNDSTKNGYCNCLESGGGVCNHGTMDVDNNGVYDTLNSRSNGVIETLSIDRPAVSNITSVECFNKVCQHGNKYVLRNSRVRANVALNGKINRERCPNEKIIGSHDDQCIGDDIGNGKDGTKLNITCDANRTRRWNPQDKSENWSRNRIDKFLQRWRDTATRKFTVLGNLLHSYDRPCVMDIKLGRRLRAVYKSDDHRRKKEGKSARSTAAMTSFAICGLNVYKVDQSSYITLGKDCCRQIEVGDINEKIHYFFSNGRELRCDVIREIILKLEKLVKVLSIQDIFCFYSSSLLIIYDASDTSLVSSLDGKHRSPRTQLESETLDCEVQNTDEILTQLRADVRLIDFAHCFAKKDLDSSVCNRTELLDALRNLISYMEQMLCI